MIISRGLLYPVPDSPVAWCPFACPPAPPPPRRVSPGMRALGTSFYLLTVALGTYLATALNVIIAAISPVDLWVADNPLYGHYDW